MKKITNEHRVVLHGSLVTYPHHVLDADDAVLPDNELIRAMTGEGGFLLARKRKEGKRHVFYGYHKAPENLI